MRQKKKRGESYDWQAWPGTDTLRWTQIPDDWLDTLIPQLSEAEVRVLLCIGRHTYGWKKDWEQISLTQIVEHTGLSRTAANRAAKSLEAKGIIEVRRAVTASGGAAPNTYRPVEMGGSASSVLGGSTSKALGGSASSVLSRKSRSRDKTNESIRTIANTYGTNDRDRKALETSLSKFPAEAVKWAAELLEERRDRVENAAAYLNVLVPILAKELEQRERAELTEHEERLYVVRAIATIEREAGYTGERLRERLVEAFHDEALVAEALGEVNEVE